MSYKIRSALIALLIAAGLAACGGFLLHLHWIVAVLLAMNLVTFAYYGYDKSSAGDGRARVPEATLQLLAVLGGSPGALLAQRVFRHKTSKRGFQAIFWVTCGVQLGLATWYVWRQF